jgi:hypothetical protein
VDCLSERRYLSPQPPRSCRSRAEPRMGANHCPEGRSDLDRQVDAIDRHIFAVFAADNGVDQSNDLALERQHRTEEKESR